jgi:hypothetical protein
MKTYEEQERDEVIKSVTEKLTKAVQEKSIDAWFFNWAESDRKDRKDAEKVVNTLLGGKWRFVHIWGNFTNVGEGWFANDKYGIYVTMACFDEEGGDEFIDDFNVYTTEQVAHIYGSVDNIENKR